MKKTLLTLPIMGLFLFSIVLLSCDKDDPAPVVEITPNTGRKVNYTVLVVPGENLTTRSANGLNAATVTVSVNGVVTSKVTDHSGQAAFADLRAGIIAVTVSASNYTTLNYVVDLTKNKPDSLGSYDGDDVRYASTMVAIFPLTGSGTATVKGRATAQLDLTNSELETALEGTTIVATLYPEDLDEYINHSEPGQILNVAYEFNSAIGTIDAQGNYSMVVPATGGWGLEIDLYPSSFEYDQVTSSGLVRKVYYDYSETVYAVSGVTYYEDFSYRY